MRELLDIFGIDEPVSCVQYAKDNNLLEKPRWKWFRQLVKNDTTFKRLGNQAHLKSIRRSTVHKYGFEVVQSHAHTMQLDAKNGNNKWKDAVNTELLQLVEDEMFEDKGKGAKVPKDYKLIWCHFVFNVKHDGHHKSSICIVRSPYGPSAG